MSKKEFNADLEQVFHGICDMLNYFSKSTILQKFFWKECESFFYSTLINNFFLNLNQANIIKYNLPKGKLSKIKSYFKETLVDIKLSLALKHNDKINYGYYLKFKKILKRNFPAFQRIILEIEKEIDFKKSKHILTKYKKKLRNLGKPRKDMNSYFLTKAIEVYVEQKKQFPRGKKIDKLIKILAERCLPRFSEEVMKTLKKDSKSMLNLKRDYLKGFEARLYVRWEEPFDLLECLICVSLEASVIHQKKLVKSSNSTNNYKREALIKIHARALQISNEILTLLRAGYADGANARWRSLHELAVTSFFLLHNNNDLAKRYLDHEIIKKFKQAKDYRFYCKKLGYPLLRIKEFNKIKREKERLCNEYADRFQEEYGWIPRSILTNRNFRELEKQVKLDKLRPYYSMSCDAVHAGSKGFYRLGLTDELQNKILLVGASNYGLATPLQNTAISLLQVNVCLLNLEPDFENLAQMQIINSYVKELRTKSAEVQDQIDKEEKSK